MRLLSGHCLRGAVCPQADRQLRNVRCVVRKIRGQPVRRFERKSGMRAEALDCVVYAFAARTLVTANLDRREDDLASFTAVPPAFKPVVRSAWVEGRS